MPFPLENDKERAVSLFYSGMNDQGEGISMVFVLRRIGVYTVFGPDFTGEKPDQRW